MDYFTDANLAEVRERYQQDGERAMESAALYLKGSALQDFGRIVANYVASSSLARTAVGFEAGG